VEAGKLSSRSATASFRVVLEQIKDYEGNVIVDVNQEVNETWPLPFRLPVLSG